jgi:FkbM family methyltransferase
VTELSPPWPVVRDLAQHLDVETVFDVGAHDGRVSEMFRTVFPSARVYAFEPDPETFTELTRRLGRDPLVIKRNIAVGEAVGETPFHRGVASYTSSRFPRNTTGRRYYHSSYVMRETITVPMETLDSFVAKEGIERINVLKIDTQGGEFSVLRGAALLLVREAIDIIVSEFFFIAHYEGAPLLPEIWQLLRGHGYDLYDMALGPRGTNGQIRFGDAIFVSRTFRREHLDALPAEP